MTMVTTLVKKSTGPTSRDLLPPGRDASASSAALNSR
jgi:hypothetical protein